MGVTGISYAEFSTNGYTDFSSVITKKDKKQYITVKDKNNKFTDKEVLLDDYVNSEGYEANGGKSGSGYSTSCYKRTISWVILSDLKDFYLTANNKKKGIKSSWQVKQVKDYDLSTSIPTYHPTRVINDDDVKKINQILAKYDISNENRVCHFLSQCHAETDMGIRPIEQFTGNSPKTDPAILKYETKPSMISDLGNTSKGDSYTYRGAGGLQITGRANYTSFSTYLNNSFILSDGTLYVGKEYFWESAANYWSVYKPNSANTDKYNLNKKCDQNASSGDITGIINAGKLKEVERKEAYDYYKSIIVASRF